MPRTVTVVPIHCSTSIELYDGSAIMADKMSAIAIYAPESSRSPDGPSRSRSRALSEAVTSILIPVRILKCLTSHLCRESQIGVFRHDQSAGYLYHADGAAPEF